MDDEYLTPQAITKIYGLTSTTLRCWAEAGKIKHIRPLGTRRLYSKSDVLRIFEPGSINQNQTPLKKQILYARVSSAHQSEDLERQINYLRSKYPSGQIIKDIGSGLNWNRKGFEALLELIHTNSVSEIVVAYKDRLCRFGFELFEWICQKHNAKILVLNPCSETEDRTKELAEDLFAIVNVFVAKSNGLRAARNRHLRASAIGAQNHQDQDAPKSGSDTET